MDKKLREATRFELAEELKRRQSVSTVRVPKSEGAVINHSRGKVSVKGEADIFVIDTLRQQVEDVIERSEGKNIVRG